MSNIVGLNLDINEDYLGQAIKDTVMAGIAESLDKDKIVSGLINTVLSTKVNKDGNIPHYSYEETMSILEYYLQNIVREEIKSMLKEYAENNREEIRKSIKKELQKTKTISKFEQAFIDTVLNNLSSEWRTSIDINFDKINEY